MMVVTSSTVAENAVCWCEGRKIRRNRRGKDIGLELTASLGPGIKRDFTWKNPACIVPQTAPEAATHTHSFRKMFENKRTMSFRSAAGAEEPFDFAQGRPCLPVRRDEGPSASQTNT